MVEVKIEIPDDIMDKLLKKYPGENLEGALKKLLEEELEGKGSEAEMIEKEILSLQSIANNLQRVVMAAGDTLNSYSQMLSDMRLRLAEIWEFLKEVNERISRLESMLQAPSKPQEVVQVQQQRPEAREIRHERSRERRSSAIEILKKQRIMFESDLASKIRNRDAFFERLRKDGALVLTLSDQRIAIDPEYWREFLSTLEALRTNAEKELKEALGHQGYQLLMALSKSALAYFDATKKKWVVLLE